MIRISLEYGARPDPFSEHRAGFEIRTRRRCERIVISTCLASTILSGLTTIILAGFS